MISVAMTVAEPAEDLIVTLDPLFVIWISSPPTVFTFVVPRGISPAIIEVGNTCLKRILDSRSLFIGWSKSGRVPSASSPNASLVGAKTVKSPSPLNVSAKPAALTAVNSVERLCSAAAVSAIDLSWFDCAPLVSGH